MLFLQQLPRFVFFTGKGGVGKTSVACASAVWLAEQGLRVLLVSTDPASNVGQVFGVPIGNQITALNAVPGLAALEIVPQAAAHAYRERVVAPVRGILPAEIVRGIEEQLSGACTTEIAAFDEFTALLIDSPQTASYDHILFDTAPTGHTIRLLQLPGAWSHFLGEGKGDVSCLGPLTGLAQQQAQYEIAVALLRDRTRTRLVLVARAQYAALREAARTYEELVAVGLTDPYLVINGVMPEPEGIDDPLVGAIRVREQAAFASIPAILARLPQDVISLKPHNVVGVPALKSFFATGPEPIMQADVAQARVTPLHSLVTLMDDIAPAGHGLVMVMGKGGVGKTTLAAAIAVELARRGLPVHLTTSDPAAHLTHTLDGALPQLTVSRIDPQQETERYRNHVLASRGHNLDAAGRALLEEDLRSPCTEEIAVFQAFSRVIKEADTAFVVMDTAPTGHTLLLLDATGAYHREVSRQMRDGNHNTLTPLRRLQDGQQTKVLIATLAEATPVLEAVSLQEDLRRAGIEPWAWIINASVAAAHPRAAFLRARAVHEHKEIMSIIDTHARRYAVVPLLTTEPAGFVALQGLMTRSSGVGETMVG